MCLFVARTRLQWRVILLTAAEEFSPASGVRPCGFPKEPVFADSGSSSHWYDGCPHDAWVGARVEILSSTAELAEVVAAMSALVDAAPKTIFWHRDLPPIDAVPLGEHTVEATSRRVPDTIADRDALWGRGSDELKRQANSRLVQEIARLGGRYAHVLDESIDTRHDASSGEAWLYGRFTYVLYR
jgi:hypothetical protein